MELSQTTPGKESRRCSECSKSYRNCECKSCSKCGCSFRKYTGTNLIKGRSHCRSCGSAVCLTCHMLVQGKKRSCSRVRFCDSTVGLNLAIANSNQRVKLMNGCRGQLGKICTRCHLRQREDEVSKEKALIAIEEAKYGKSSDETSLYSRLMNGEQRENILFEAAKNGDDHVLVIALDMGADVNSTDSNKNTPLFHTAESGHLTCCALLLDRKADVKTTNSSGWTPLHAVAWKGSTDNHVECAELLLEAGASAVAETLTNETAADVAERCGGKKEIIEMLRAAEVEVSVTLLREKVQSLQGIGAKERKLWRMVTCLLNHVCKSQPRQNEKGSEKKINGRIALPDETIFRTASLDRNFSRKNICHKCGAVRSPSPVKKPIQLDAQRPTADVEPILRSNSLMHEIDSDRSQLDLLDAASLRERLMKMEAEKKDWEQRCRKLMQSIATNSKESQRAMELAKEEIGRLNEEKEAELKKCEAAFANKLAKVRQETDTTIWEYQKQIEEAKEAERDLIHIQKNLKLTWVPDQIVKICQNQKCRIPFTQTNRKHHCRCCGRVFCQSCSAHKLAVPAFGYDQPVRICGTCFALIEDSFGEQTNESK